MIITRQLTDTVSASTASDIQLGSCVTEIGMGAFSGYTNITDVELPDSLTTIRESAFAKSSIQNIEIPNSVTSLEGYAFEDCESLSSCTIGSGITAMMSRRIFRDCYDLKRINSDIDGICNLPSNLKRIGDDLDIFEYCNSIKKINVPDSLMTLGDSAFIHCLNLEECTIGSGITSIGYNIFLYCTKLNKLRIKALIPPNINSSALKSTHCQIYVPCVSYDAYTGDTNWSTYKSRIVCDDMAYKVKFYLSDNSYGGLIPCDESNILRYAEIQNAYLDEYTKIEIGACVTELESYLFGGKTNIDTIDWDTTTSSTITKIGKATFNDLSNTRFPSILPPNIQFIDESSFANCHIDNVYLNSGITFGGGASDNGAFQGSHINNLNYDVNTEISFIFAGATISSLTIGDNVVSIPYKGFISVKDLETIYIPSGVTSIGASAFEYCNSLTSVTIPAATIGQSAFRNARNLTTLNIDSGATLEGSGRILHPFDGCNNITTINSNEVGKAYLNIATIGESFANIKIEELILGNNVSNIGINLGIGGTFNDCSNLEKVHIIGNSSTQILNGSFMNSPNLKEIIIDNCSNYGNAFSNCPKIEKATIGSGVTASNFNLKGLVSLKNVEIENGYSQITENAFSGCTSLSSITVPATVTSVGNNAFYGCNSINSISFLLNNITSLGDNCFARCSGIRSIDIPSGVTNIGSGAFSACTNAKTLIIPSSVLSIGGNAFNGCSSLTSIIVGRNTPPTIGTSVFNGSNCPIYVPAASIEVYKNAQNWSVYASRIRPISTT